MSVIITVGNDVINRSTSRSVNTTYIDRLVPCDGDGFLTQVKAWFATSGANFRVAVFRFVSGTTYKCVSVSDNLGSVTSGAERTFNLSKPLYIKAGDFIGCHFTGGSIEANSSGGALSALAGDNTTPGTEYNFTTNNAYIISLKATGADALDSGFRETVSYSISEVVENNLGIVPVQVSEPLPEETLNTAFIKSVEAGNNIILTAPSRYNGRVFSGWKIITPLGNESITPDNPVTVVVNENLEIRALYIKPQFRETVEYIVGPIYVCDDNISGFRETAEYTVT